MYSISDLRLIYTLLNHEWNLLTRGEKNETWSKRFLSWVHHFKLYIWELMGYVTPNTRGYFMLALIVVMGLGIMFAIYEIMGQFLRVDSLKRLHEKQMDRKPTLISEDKHEIRSRQESQLVETVSETGITLSTLTAIVKPTVRSDREISKIAQKPNLDIQRDSRNDVTSQAAGFGTSTGKMSVLTFLKDAIKLSISDKNEFQDLTPKMDLNRLEEKISEIDLTSLILTPKCSSSLTVLSSRDSRTTNFHENVNKSETNSLDDSIPVCNAEDVSIIQNEIKNKTSQFEAIRICGALPSPLIPQANCENRNSSHILGHFAPQLPELDFSPIADIQNLNSVNPLGYQKSYGKCESHKNRAVKCENNKGKENSSVRLDELKILNEPREEYRKDQSDSSRSSRKSSHRSRSLSKKTPSNIPRRAESESQIVTEEHRHTCDVSRLQSRIPRRSPSVEPTIHTKTNDFKIWLNPLFPSRNLMRKLCCNSVANVTFTPESGSKIPVPTRSFRWNNSNSPDFSSPVLTYTDSTNITDNSVIESSPVIEIEKPYTQSKKENPSLIESCISRRYNVARLQDGRTDRKDEIPLKNESEAPQQYHGTQNPRQIVTCGRKLAQTSCSRPLQNVMAVRYGKSEVTQIPRRSYARKSPTRTLDFSLNSLNSLEK